MGSTGGNLAGIILINERIMPWAFDGFRRNHKGENEELFSSDKDSTRLVFVLRLNGYITFQTIQIPETANISEVRECCIIVLSSETRAIVTLKLTIALSSDFEYSFGILNPT